MDSDRVVHELECPVDGVRFRPQRKTQVYCSSACYNKAKHRRSYGREVAQRMARDRSKPRALVGIHAEIARIRVDDVWTEDGRLHPGWRVTTIVHTCPACGGHNVQPDTMMKRRMRFVCWECPWHGVVWGRGTVYSEVADRSGFPDMSKSPIAHDGEYWFT
jgi:hypothetical protein